MMTGRAFYIKKAGNGSHKTMYVPFPADLIIQYLSRKARIDLHS